MALPEADAAAPWTLAEALAALKRTSKDRRSLTMGSPEHTAALREEVRLSETIYRLARQIR